ncbi:sulfotransferase [Thalassotalea psychrophila]|uniref:Sulfotransferase n=1 Tax=Thalassotalea psychrophila TaxID=3065647 RepID=A0ABY9TUL7_9GAMM|nr:sulfotransferase [Colwelliaceae bacterium SQ149]
MTDNYPIFILGTQRSGTTLLARILSAHPDIFIQNELDLSKCFDQKHDTPTITDAIKHQILTKSDVCIDTEISKNQHLVWGLKDPQLTEHTNKLLLFLPKSKFILIVRDARGVVNSYIENKWGLGTNAYSGSLRWRKEVSQQLDFMNKYPDNFLFIRYEDIIEDLETSMKQVCQFLGKAFSQELLKYDQKSSNYIKRRENINTFKKPDPTLATKWKNRLSTFQVSIIEELCDDLMTRLDYPLLTQGVTLNPWQKLYFIIHQKIIGEIQLQYRWRKSAIFSWLQKYQNKAFFKER